MFARPGLRRTCLAVALSPLLLAACAGPSSEQDAAAPDAEGTPAATTTAPAAAADTTTAASVIPLTGYHWRLTDARRGSDSRIDALFVRGDRPITLEFDGKRVSVRSNAAGNFYSAERLRPPFRARVSLGGQVSEMQGTFEHGGCNACHTWPAPPSYPELTRLTAP